MDRRIRYEPLDTEDDEQPAEHITVAMAQPPEVSDVQPSDQPTDQTQQTDAAATADKVPEPPSYNIATSLPTYEEAERTKAEEAEQAEQRQEQEQDDDAHRTLFGIRWHTADGTVDAELGTDGLFLCTFLVAFLFNWVGLIASLCLTYTVAGRLGAISGFGLSLVKWVAIVKHSGWGAQVGAQGWIWWLLIILGFLVFFRGCTQYIRIKRQWKDLNPYMRRRVFLYF